MEKPVGKLSVIAAIISGLLSASPASADELTKFENSNGDELKAVVTQLIKDGTVFVDPTSGQLKINGPVLDLLKSQGLVLPEELKNSVRSVECLGGGS